MSNDSESEVTRTRYKEQIHVSGKLGTRTVRREDEPDYGTGGVHCVVTFDGVVDWRDDAVFGPVTLDEMTMDDFIGDIDGRVDEYEVHTFEKEDGDT